ncbi:uncharacterized protein Z519_04378 [Cladophialophora bantiana CBS 173.52]|uniref:ABC transporter domain-containing protein n=1 Tax=Cladophialophora bantiana (strain ATCC 10958 / CBS 173.52 / CDC B-1940 / NIH 8579) TaxID=1442370 RepID=A0A0D2G713_CLAB1|nr:uncharacterized protein Z519_04378 [Cladophialophora bantiana CBS 173.52]KIW94402.1 hypothetical protein Z519_04378 [Cladophialophora bantiana CBS 173.52]
MACSFKGLGSQYLLKISARSIASSTQLPFINKSTMSGQSKTAESNGLSSGPSGEHFDGLSCQQYRLGSATAGNDIGYGLITATGCIYVGIAISTAIYKHQLYRHITLVRGALVTLIYSETVSVEQTFDGPSAILTLMNTDVDRIYQRVFVLPDLWSRPLELAVGTILLALQIGLGHHRRFSRHGDDRRKSQDMERRGLGFLKCVKILGLTGPIHLMLQNERLRELRFQVKFRQSTVWLNTLGNVPPALAAAVTFIAYAIKAKLEGSASINASEAFTNLALISLVAAPSANILTAYPAAASCIGCLSGIKAYLMKPRAHTLNREVTETNALPNKENSGFRAVQDAACISRSNTRRLSGYHDILQTLDSILQPGNVTFILGPSGSGKSTFLRAVMGKMCHSEPIWSRGELIYCEKVPWLFTGTIQENICSTNIENFDEGWYRSVLATCALQNELISLPRGDLTHIDGQASSLNGSQKQRAVLARALYLRPRLNLLDDLLSSSDLETERPVIQGLLGRDGLLRKLHATGVIVAQSWRYAEVVDCLFAIDSERNASLILKAARFDDSIFNTDADLPASIGESKPTDEKIKIFVVVPGTGLAGKLARNDSDFSDYAYYFKSMGWLWVVSFFLFTIVQTICYYMSQVILQWWTADGGLDVAKWTPLYFFLACDNAIFFGLTTWVKFLKLAPESAANLHRILLDTVTNGTYLFLAKTDVGILLNRFSQVDLQTSRRLRVIELELRSPLYSHFLETMKGLSSIRRLHWEQQFTDRMIKKLDDSQIPYYLLYLQPTHRERRHRSDGGIELHNLIAGYNASDNTLNNITMSIRPGEKIGLRGRAESGKTSLLAFLRLLDVSQGSVIVDGIDLSTVPHATIRERILSVPKDSFLIQRRTVRFNVDPNGEHNNAQIISAFAKTFLWPILEKNDGLDTIIASELLSPGKSSYSV